MEYQMTNRESCSRWANESSNIWPPRVGNQRHAPEPEHRLAQSLIEDHAADDLAEAMSGSVSLALTNVRHDADRLHPLRRTQSDRDLAHLIRTLLRFSAQRERGPSTPTSLAAASHDKPGSAPSTPTVPATPRREGPGRPPGDVSRRRSWQGLHAGRAGSNIPDGGSSDRTLQLWDWPPPVQSAPRRLVTPTSSSRWGSAAAELSSQAAGISPCGCGTWPLT